MNNKEIIGQYTLTLKCGYGAYGEVFLAEDLSGRQVALKRIAKNQYCLDWQREFNGLMKYCHKQLNHPNLIKIYHIEENKDYFYYTMELADNLNDAPASFISDTLANRLVRKMISLNDAVTIIKQLLDGLEVLHNNNLTHRDIKPANIIFVDKIPKLSDIGLMTTINTTVSFAGTMGFTPHEQLLSAIKKKHHRYTNQSDIYAMGKVLYCMVTHNSADDFPVFPLELMSQNGMKQLNQIINKACNENPRMRFENVEEFKDALNAKAHANILKRKVSLKHVAAIIFILVIIAIIAGSWEYRKSFTAPSAKSTATNNIDEPKQTTVISPQPPETRAVISQLVAPEKKMTIHKPVKYPQSGSFFADSKIDDDF